MLELMMMDAIGLDTSNSFVVTVWRASNLNVPDEIFETKELPINSTGGKCVGTLLIVHFLTIKGGRLSSPNTFPASPPAPHSTTCPQAPYTTYAFISYLLHILYCTHRSITDAQADTESVASLAHF